MKNKSKLSKVNEQSISNNNPNTENKIQQKTYINFYFCKLSLGLIVAYLYTGISILMNIINRILFHTYYFKFNFTLLFLQQLFCMLTFAIISKTSKNFKKAAGELSFSDFKKLKTNYLFFALVYILNNLMGFYGNQLISNTPMFLTLRKLILVMIYLTDLFLDIKPFSVFTAVCIFLVTFGSFISGITDFSLDYVGYIVVIIYNIVSVLHTKLSENFKKKTGIPNLKLLVYNSYLSCPVLVLLCFLTGEYKKLIKYFQEFDGDYFKVFIFIFVSCFLCVLLITSNFISNEKNSSLFTAMLSNCKDIMITILGYFFLKGNKFTWNIISGLVISTIGAAMIQVKSILDNMIKNNQKQLNKKIE